MEKEYYERYWEREIADKKGFANLPPERDGPETDRIVNILKPYVRGRVLDAGCGDGSLSNRIQQLPNVSEVAGVDIADTAVHIAQSKCPGIQFKVGEVTNLPFESNFFDVVVAVEMVEHVYDTQLMFKEFSRVLKTGGILVITTTDFNLLKKVAVALLYWDKYFFPTNPHIRFYSKKSLESVLHEFGFSKVIHFWNGSYFKLMPKGQVMISKKL